MLTPKSVVSFHEQAEKGFDRFYSCRVSSKKRVPYKEADKIYEDTCHMFQPSIALTSLIVDKGPVGHENYTWHRDVFHRQGTTVIFERKAYHQSDSVDICVHFFSDINPNIKDLARKLVGISQDVLELE